MLRERPAQRVALRLQLLERAGPLGPAFVQEDGRGELLDEGVPRSVA